MGISALDSALTGLNVAQRQLDVISRNVANASTEGYTRKTLAQQTLVLNGRGVGVKVSELQRSVNQSVLNDSWLQNSIAGGAEIKQSYLTRVQQVYGASDSESSFAASLSKVKDTLVALAADPNSGITQTQVLNQARDFATKVNNTSNNLQSLRNGVQSAMQDSVSQVNQLLDNIASINVQIIKIQSVNGNSTVDLQDQRDQAIKSLAGLMDVTYYKTEDGGITVQTKTGTVLADATARHLNFSPSQLNYNSYYPASAAAITLNGQDVTSQITDGNLGALIQLRDQTLPTYQAQLDEFAHKTALRFQAQGVKLFTDNTGAVPTDVVANYVGFSAKMQINSAIVNDVSLLQKGTGGGPAPAPGDNTNITKLIDYAFGDYADAASTAHTAYRITNLGASGTLTLNLPASDNILDYANTVIARQAQDFDQAKANATYQTDYRDTLFKKLQDDSGVSIDTELAFMTGVQKSYQASARTITVVNQMFDELLKSF